MKKTRKRTDLPIPGPDKTRQLIGEPTVLAGFGGLRVLTEPIFDPPGERPSPPVVLHKQDGWAELICDADDVRLAFSAAGTAERPRRLAPGEPTEPG